jgi:hypothetical protein
MVCVHLSFTQDIREKAQIRGMLEAERDLLMRLLGQYELLNSRRLVDDRGCSRYVQIHMAVAESLDKSIIDSARGEGS